MVWNTTKKNSYPHMFNGLPPMRQTDDENDGLGPLPLKWEKAYTENGELYFIDHNTGTSHWLDPRLSKFQKKSLEECSDDELPYGWEKIHDPQYGTYFIDHVNRRTQYENPVLEAKRRAERNRNETPKQTLPYQFTKNPAEMCGERITTTLLKSSRGLGITIVGGDDNIEEFLQIKSIVPNGPAWLDGKLQTGDILVYVNDTCVLGFTHHEMVNVFQSILPGETVTLEVCRGYPLPFDPNDPNTEVVTTIAVDGINSDPEKARILMDLNMDGNYNFLDLSDSTGAVGGGDNNTLGQKNPLSKIQSGNGGTDQHDSYNNDDILMYKKPEILNISIIKGVMGFGFTIADSAYGQKVKKILDRNCCKNLQEGDILLEINNTSVKHMSHSEVVQVLKDCPKTQETVLKVQRGNYFTGGINGSGRAAKVRKSGGMGSKEVSGSGLYRSKTPTADLYSTQAKEVLPIRPKTPLVDTRRARAKTPNTDLNEEVEAVTNSLAKNDDNKSIAADAKSNNSLNELDSINNEIPYMDPLPNIVTSLSERLAEASMLQDNHNNIYQNSRDPLSVTSNRPHYENQVGSGSDYNYHSPYGNGNNGTSYNNSSLYSPPPPMPLMAAPVPTYHQDTCYCYECCQDYNSRYQMEYHLQPTSASHQAPSNSIYHQQYPPMMPPLQNGRATQKRVNEYIIDRRKAGFSPLENHSANVLPNPNFPQAYWKYGTTPTTGLVQPVSTEDEYTLSEVTLERQALGFGFRIVGGTEEGSQVTVGHIVPGGSADGDPRIATGDEILSIDGVNVINASHHKVVSLMGEAALRGQVKMILRRRIRNPPPVRSIRYPYDVIVSRNENEGFGFVIISSSNQYYGSTIGKLIPGSPAERCGDLKVGDRIIAVNRIEITGMSHGDVVNLIKDSGLHVRLTIGSPKDIPPLVQQSQPSPVSAPMGTAPKPSAVESAYFDRTQLVQHPQL
ncbi:membrane-associated guanylate kinase, WW and PDZ domain-containing protein 1-like isoform X2 [Hermetia illucens]|uniref:membrane-associated guanylate kinase, WW and PDZ domain-containing protein 1-like isoform X2 n=1 Tax=Hermetia illucens TaxID=343691 RepID=UPI0018CC3F08|nr:membrane-associated guanylate kinase, WW and PDZ domain-containing protein 1-like isoform X2 [Hermetia illucens]